MKGLDAGTAGGTLSEPRRSEILGYITPDGLPRVFASFMAYFWTLKRRYLPSTRLHLTKVQGVTIQKAALSVFHSLVRVTCSSHFFLLD
jgi:hypothetical protein